MLINRNISRRCLDIVDKMTHPVNISQPLSPVKSPLSLPKEFVKKWAWEQRGTLSMNSAAQTSVQQRSSGYRHW